MPIPGTTKQHRLAENVAAVDVELTAQDRADLTAASDGLPAQPDRYPESKQRMINR
ncbi:hypothetical protein [Cellulomonas endophytica]|uniref:hypothetical protein n=1 Tax=Cellulomonas endophytica TaxID=2494735 RepID=UPI0013E95CC8|nr:hypothetical protein [Cellulomonas endophytica]